MCFSFFPIKVSWIKSSNALCCFLRMHTECSFENFGEYFEYFFRELLLISWFCEHLFLQSVLWKALYSFSFRILQLKNSNESMKKGLLIKMFCSFYRNSEYRLPISSIQTQYAHSRYLNSQNTRMAEVTNCLLRSFGPELSRTLRLTHFTCWQWWCSS